MINLNKVIKDNIEYSQSLLNQITSTINKIYYFSLFGVATSYAQTTVLHVGSEDQLYIPAQSIVSMNGLVYEPSSDHIISDNTLIKSQQVLHPLENAQPISYQWKTLINEYSGNISMTIEELDLSDEEKENLVMYHYNNKWIFNTQNQKSEDRLSIQGTFVSSSFIEHSLSISEDIDFDGVLNDNDECPDSEFGTTVDAKGCDFVSEEVKVYPNPTNGPLQLYISGMDNEVSLKVTSINGSLVYSRTKQVPMNRVVEIDLSDLSNGLYIVSLQGSSVQVHQKVIKR